MSVLNDDTYFMRLALNLAVKAKGQTSPNPIVGALVVKNGRIVGRGYHKKAGAPHAEVVAIEEAKNRAKGALLYVTLEPCSHFGRTPPCVNRIIESGIKEVVTAALDPNPLNNGRGIRALKTNRVKVTSGVLEKEAKKVNEVFFKFITKGMPFVTIKLAQSLDGKIATASGESKWISNELSRKFAQRLRARVDAVLVGVETIIKDNPLLTCRLKSCKRQPFRIVVDSRLRTPPGARIFSGDACRVILAATRRAPAGRIKTFKAQGAKVLLIKALKKRVCLKSLMKKLAKLDITHVLVEGGGEVAASCLQEGVADKMFFFISPKIIGGRSAKTGVEGEGAKRIKEAINLKNIKVSRFGKDILVEGYLS